MVAGWLGLSNKTTKLGLMLMLALKLGLVELIIQLNLHTYICWVCSLNYI